MTGNPELDLFKVPVPLKEEHVTYNAASDEETINVGRRLGNVLKEGDVIALAGELGSGKTWFTKGIALGLDIPPDVVITSPTFTLINEYQGRHKFVHLDAYRLENLSDFRSAGLDEVFFQACVVAMEWADRWPEILPDRRLDVMLAIMGEHRRAITLSGHHPRSREILKDMRNRRDWAAGGTSAI